MAAPTFVAAYAGASWVTTTTPKTASVTTGAGDILVACVGAAGGNATHAAPTGHSLTFTSRGFNPSPATDNSFTFAELWTATDATGASFTLSATLVGSPAAEWGFSALRFSGSAGVGAQATPVHGQAAGTVSITTTAANSAVVVLATDWTPADGTVRTWATVNGITPTIGNGFETTYVRDAAAYAVYVAYYPDVGAIGPYTVGVSSPSTGSFTVCAVEIKGSAGLSPVAAPRSLVIGDLAATQRAANW